MRCPVCGNEVYDLVDSAIARCTRCSSLFDPYGYPGFPKPNVRAGEKWDTTGSNEIKFPEGFSFSTCSLCGSHKHSTYNHQFCALCNSGEHATIDHKDCAICGSHEHSTLDH